MFSSLPHAALTSVLLLGLGAALATDAEASDRPLPKALQGVQRIVTLGDSITQAGEQPGGYVWLIRKTLETAYPSAGIQVLNAGISGHKSTDMQDRFQRDVLSKKPQLVTISVGVNDVWHGFYNNHPQGDGPLGVPLEVYKERVRHMVRAAQAEGIRVVILSTTVIQEDPESPENRKLKAYNAALKAIARETGSQFIDLNTPFHRAIREHFEATGDRANWLTTDGVHMNPRGNRLMARLILKGLGVSSRVQDDVYERFASPLP